MSPRQHLQPNNATRYERAISEAMDRAPELRPAIEAIRGFKFDPSEAILPYLIAEYGLTEVADYLDDPRTAIAEGLVWQRLRGTPAALHRALNWIGHDGQIEEQPSHRRKWWWFQVHLPFEVRNSDFAAPMTGLAKASKPLRSEFARVTSGYDKRGFVLNQHRLNGGALLNSWSGVRRRAGEPVLSLRYHHRAILEFDLASTTVAKSRLRMVRITDAGIATMQRSSTSVAMAPSMADFSRPDTIQFQHAPFTDGPFGTPSPRSQRGF